MKSIFDFFKKKKLQKTNNEEQLPDLEELQNLSPDEIKMIQGIVELSKTEVHQIMKPRIDVVAVDIKSSIRDIVKVVVECGHSRIPVYNESIDNIIGVLYAKDLLFYFFDENKSLINLKSILRTPLFVPETKKISDLLREFKEKKIHIALVVDEYGGFSGLVCLEDILEEIVGEIRDEYDKEKELISKIEENTYRISAKISIVDLNDKLDLEIPEEISDSLGGFIMEQLGRIPKPGDVVKFNNLEFKIEKMSSYKIENIILKIYPEEKTDEKE